MIYKVDRVATGGGCAGQRAPPTDNGTLLFGAGATPATSFLKQSGVHLDSKGYIVVNKVGPAKHTSEGKS